MCWRLTDRPVAAADADDMMTHFERWKRADTRQWDGRGGIVLAVVALVALAACADAASVGETATDAVTTENAEQVPHHGSTESSVESSMGATFEFEGRRYSLSCGVVDPWEVDPTPIGSGSRPERGAEDIAVHRVENVDPDVLVAVPNDPNDIGCDLVDDQRWATGMAEEAFFGSGATTSEANRAWCSAASYPPDPDEGFDC